ncbi:unnamed protein product [Blepharisma stoltei]|uniref:Uncharacterized protein n=1 Tax=Blepharisma stoltei TaxID=1481888 RepID=A0AAU9ID39_9CILI|nr:unnamed protein product [Blepharisma stoltei]
MVVSAYFMQIMTSSTMILSGKTEWLAANSVINSFGLILLIALIVVFYTLTGKGRKPIYDEEVEEKTVIKIDPKLYQHPIDVLILNLDNSV